MASCAKEGTTAELPGLGASRTLPPCPPHFGDPQSHPAVQPLQPHNPLGDFFIYRAPVTSFHPASGLSWQFQEGRTEAFQSVFL